MGEAVRAAREAIKAVGSDEAALEAEMLVMHALGIDRVRLYQGQEDRLSGEQAAFLQQLIERRLGHEPVAYILGRKEFFGMEFEVSPVALIPRPETETLVELAIAFGERRGESLVVVDVGVGAGTIGVCLAKSLDDARIIATDVSNEALELARRNAQRHGVLNRIEFRRGDMLEPVGEPVDVIAANLPYVTTDQWEGLPPEIRGHEPRGALDGSTDGLVHIRRLFEQAPGCLGASGALFCEIGDWQGEAALEMARAAFPDARVEIARDLGGRDRVVCVYT